MIIADDPVIDYYFNILKKLIINIDTDWLSSLSDERTDTVNSKGGRKTISHERLFDFFVEIGIRGIYAMWPAIFYKF